MAATAFVQLPLGRMVDLAISSPDGSVNFHLLHAILHALIQKSSAQNLAIEIHGAEAAKLQDQIKGTPEKPTFTIKETIDKSAQGKDQQIYVMQPDTAYTGLGSVSKEKIDALESEINELKKQIQEMRDLPGNLGIIDAVKNADNQSTVLDVFHMLTLQKRVEAAEEGMVKVATIVEDLIKSPGALSLETRNVVCQKDEAEAEGGGTKNGSKSSLKKSSKSSRSSMMDNEFFARLRQLPLDEQMRELIKEVCQLRRNCGDMETSVLGNLTRDLEEIQLRLKMKKKKSSDTLVGEEGEGEGVAELPPDVEYGLMDDKFREIAEHLERLDLTFTEEVSRLHNQFTDIEKDFNELLNKIEMGIGTGDTGEPNACCAALYQKLGQIQSDISDIMESSSKLMEDRDSKARTLEVITEQIEVLKTVKADREDMEEALADKADACAVLRKVSHDQFDSACEELSKGIEEALEKLSQQELLWQQALDDIQSEIGNKLDKMDLGPLRDFINNKLRMLQDKMKSLAALKREQEAAGSKNKLLRDINCISCDKDVVMRKEYDLSFRPTAPIVPPTRSMAPYLAYELDNLRKQQKSIPGSKNLNNFEAAMGGGGRLQKKTDDHICNRYCGGSHTITTPQQRVTRLGHFLMQWGPEAQPSTGSEKRTSSQAQTTSVVMQPEVGGSPTKSGSKVDAKRSSRSSPKSGSKQNLEEDMKRRSSQASAGEGKKGSSQGSLKGSQGSGQRGMRGSKSGAMPETIPEEGRDDDIFENDDILGDLIDGPLDAGEGGAGLDEAAAGEDAPPAPEETTA